MGDPVLIMSFAGVGPAGKHSDPELAVEVRRGNTLIRSLRWRFRRGKRSDPELAVEGPGRETL